MNPTDISIVGPGTGGPTLSDKYIINLTHLLLFIIISSLIVLFINKKTKKENISNEKNENIENKNNKNSQMFSLIFALISSLFFTKSCAVIAQSVYVYNIVSITINFVIIFIVNYVLQLIFNKNEKKDLKSIFKISVIENIVFNIVFVIGLIITNNFMAIIIALVIITIYKILKINHSNTKILHNVMYVILYSIILSSAILAREGNMISKNMISERDYNGHGFIIESERDEYWNNEPIKKYTDITIRIQ